MAALTKMSSYFAKQQKKQKYQSDNPIEIIKDFGVGIVSSVAKDLVGGTVKNATEQLGITPALKIEGTLNPNEDLALEQISAKKEDSEMLFFGEKQLFRPMEQKSTSLSEMEVEQKIEYILCELKLLAKSVEKVNIEASKIALEQPPIKGGVYHANFFEWILRMIKMARAKVDESNLWLEQFRARHKQKGYWQMFKKHGTGFALSGERSVASSVG